MLLETLGKTLGPKMTLSVVYTLVRLGLNPGELAVGLAKQA